MKPSIQYRTVAPTVEPVTLAEAKTQLKVDFPDHDTYISTLITVAREWVEEQTKRALLDQTWVCSYESWPGDGVFELIRPPFISLTTLKYRDTSDVDTTVSGSNYQVESLAFPAEVKLICSYSRPTLQADRLYPITITYKAGYGATADKVPAKIRQAILMFVHHLYDNRVPVIQGTIVTKVPLSVESLIASIKRRNM